MKKTILIIFIFCFCRVEAQFYKHTYTAQGPTQYRGIHDVTISGKSFTGNTAVLLDLRNCYNIHITKCKFSNALSFFGIQCKESCYNITIDSCDFTNLRSGVYMQGCLGGLVVNHNQFYNMMGPYPQGHAVQFDNCNGAGSMMMYNNCQSAANPGTGDVLNVFQSNGTPTSPIKVDYNLILGGGTAVGNQGAAGIVLGDVGGTYQEALHNIVVNGGAAGIIVQGGSYLTVQYNTILEELTTPWGAGGAACFVASSSGPSSNITFGDNLINGYAGQYGYYRDTIYKKGTSPNIMPVPNRWKTNTISRALNRSILPLNIYDFGILPTPVGPIKKYGHRVTIKKV